MPLHLIKLCVGAESIQDLEHWMAERFAEQRRRGQSPQNFHVTRMTPRRPRAEFEGGSLYWVIKGQIAARVPLLGFTPVTGDDGVRRCRLELGLEVAPVRPRPMRAFQGWRYFADEDAPSDLATAGEEAMLMPEEMRRELGRLGLM